MSKAAFAGPYRWGEDGLAGICDYKQRLCLGLGVLELVMTQF